MTTILRLPKVRDVTGYSTSTLYLKISQQLFPKPVRLGIRAVGWCEAEVNAVTNARIAGKSDTEIRELVARLEQQRVTMA